MKKLLSIVLILLTTLISTAQEQGFNYKALIKDASGNVLANTPVRILFNIQGELSDDIFYAEDHTVTTDSNGIVILNIGRGDPDPTYGVFFWDLPWTYPVTYLNVQIDISGGTNYVDLGTTQFMAVPYAKHAETATKATTATTANNVSGLEKVTDSIDSGNGFPIYGWRLVGKNPAFYGTIGNNAVDLSDNDTFSSGTQGATGTFSTAMGSKTTALGDYSTAMGQFSTASGDWSTAMGRGTKADASLVTVIGAYNIGGGNPESWITTDPLFEIGNGTPNTASNAFTVYKNGDIRIGNGNVSMGNGNISMGILPEVQSDHLLSIGNGVGSGFLTNSNNVLTVYSSSSDNILKLTKPPEDGIPSGQDVFLVKQNGHVEMGNLFIPGDNQVLTVGNGHYLLGLNSPINSNALTVYNGTDASFSNNSGYVMIGNNDDNNLLFDTNEIMARNNGSTSTLYLQHSGGDLWAGGSFVHSSDRRLKKDIETLPYGLKEVLQLQPKAYNWKNRVQDNKSLGLIAQEVQSIIKEVVTTQDNDEQTLGISYIELIPILINAIKEQQKIIMNSEFRMTNYESEVSSLNKRMAKLEALLITKSEDVNVASTKK